MSSLENSANDNETFHHFRMNGGGGGGGGYYYPRQNSPIFLSFFLSFPFWFLFSSGKMMCSLFFYYGGWRIVSDLDDNLIDFRFISFSFSGSGSWRRPSGRRRVEDQRSGRWIAIGAVTAGRRAAAAAATIGRWRRVVGGWESLQQQTERSQSRRHPRHYRRSPTNRSATRVDRLKGEKKGKCHFRQFSKIWIVTNWFK